MAIRNGWLRPEREKEGEVVQLDSLTYAIVERSSRFTNYVHPCLPFTLSPDVPPCQVQWTFTVDMTGQIPSTLSVLYVFWRTRIKFVLFTGHEQLGCWQQWLSQSLSGLPSLVSNFLPPRTPPFPLLPPKVGKLQAHIGTIGIIDRNAVLLKTDLIYLP